MCIGHVAPESEVGGLIGLVADGDTIEVNIGARSIELAVDEAELERRRREWKPIEPRYPAGALAKYAALVGSASQGAVTGGG